MKLICAVCGQFAPGKQWWNQDTGFGICPRCFQEVSQKEGKESAEQSYGKVGTHHSTEKEDKP